MSTQNYADVQRRDAATRPGVFAPPIDFSTPLDKHAAAILRARRHVAAEYAREYRARRKNDGSVPDAFRSKQIAEGTAICKTLTPEEKRIRQRMLARLRQRACVARRKAAAAVPLDGPAGI